jgi:hypothetical protein
VLCCAVVGYVVYFVLLCYVVHVYGCVRLGAFCTQRHFSDTIRHSTTNMLPFSLSIFLLCVTLEFSRDVHRSTTHESTTSETVLTEVLYPRDKSLFKCGILLLSMCPTGRDQFLSQWDTEVSITYTSSLLLRPLPLIADGCHYRCPLMCYSLVPPYNARRIGRTAQPHRNYLSAHT